MFLFLEVSVPPRGGGHKFPLTPRSDARVTWKCVYSISYRRMSSRSVQMSGERTRFCVLTGWGKPVAAARVGCDTLLWPSSENTIRHMWFAS